MYMEHAMAGQAVSNEHEVAAAQLPGEFMMNVLRLADGFDATLFAERSGLAPTVLDAPLQTARERGLMEPVVDAVGRVQRWRPTVRGFDFLSDLQTLFL
jgi:coproporphyrinogen III oxidase-like Fe-S oxidoreductase